MKEKIIDTLSVMGAIALLGWGLVEWNSWVDKTHENVMNFLDAETTCIQEIEERRNAPYQEHMEEVKECTMRSFKPLP